MLRTLAAVALFTLTATAALAGTESKLDVPYGDLNLSQAQDAGILAQRLEAAAQTVCIKANDPDMLNSKAGHLAMQNCINTAITIAMGQVASHLENQVRANLVSARSTMP